MIEDELPDRNGVEGTLRTRYVPERVAGKLEDEAIRGLVGD